MFYPPLFLNIYFAIINNKVKNNESEFATIIGIDNNIIPYIIHVIEVSPSNIIK